MAGIPANRLVYFHNHGDPGAGLYLPEKWNLNRAQWQPRGHTLPDQAVAQHLAPLPAEGLYVVKETFFCCEKRCVEYPPRQLVQLGYGGEATPLLFIPEFSARGLGFPERGQLLVGLRAEGQKRYLDTLKAKAKAQVQVNEESLMRVTGRTGAAQGVEP